MRCAALGGVVGLDGLHRLLGGLAPQVAELHLVGVGGDELQLVLVGVHVGVVGQRLHQVTGAGPAGVAQLDLEVEARPVGLPVALPGVELLLGSVAGDGLDGRPDAVVAHLQAVGGGVGAQLLESVAVAAEHLGVGVDGAAEAAQVVADGGRLLVAARGALAQGVGRLAGEDVLGQRGGALEGVDGELDLGGEVAHGVAVLVDLAGLGPVVVAADRVAERQLVLLGLDAVDEHLGHEGRTWSSWRATWAACSTIESSSSKSMIDSSIAWAMLRQRVAISLGVLDEAAYALDHEVAPGEVVGGMVDVAERGPQVLASGVQLCLGAAQRPLVDGDRPHGDLLPRWTPAKPEVVKL